MRLSLWTQGALVTPKQERFVAEYLIDLNGTQAAIRAGYSPVRADVTASELLKRPDVAAAVDVGNRKALEAADDSAADVLRDAIATYRAAMAAEQFGPAVSALTLRARRHKDFSDKHEVTSDINLRVEALQVIANATPEQLREIAARAR